MMPSSIGDLARSFVQRRGAASLDQALTRLSQEMTSGRRADLGIGRAGDTTPVSALRQQIDGLAAYGPVAAEAALLAGSAQAALERVSSEAQNLSDAARSAAIGGDPAVIGSAAAAGRETLSAMLGALNGTVAGRGIFGGTGTGGPALADVDTVLTELASATAGALSASDVSDAIDAWFAPGGGFDTDGYLGQTQDLAPLRIAPGEEVRFDIRADNDALRGALAAAAKAAILDRGALPGDRTGQAALLDLAADDLLSASGQVVALQARLGAAEARIDSVAATNAAQGAALELAYADLTAADPYETAIALEQTRTQIEALYATTARLSGLSLVNYL